MGQFLDVNDLSGFAPDIDATKAAIMIADAEALAAVAAPCLESSSDLSQTRVAAVRAVLRGAILRWHEAGTGAYQQHSSNTGPFSEAVTYDTRQQRRGMFWPSEIEQLQDICGGRTTGAAFAVDTVAGSGFHDLACSVYFGAACSCGAVLSGGVPINGA